MYTPDRIAAAASGIERERDVPQSVKSRSRCYWWRHVKNFTTLNTLTIDAYELCEDEED